MICFYFVNVMHIMFGLHNLVETRALLLVHANLTFNMTFHFLVPMLEMS